MALPQSCLLEGVVIWWTEVKGGAVLLPPNLSLRMIEGDRVDLENLKQVTHKCLPVHTSIVLILWKYVFTRIMVLAL